MDSPSKQADRSRKQAGRSENGGEAGLPERSRGGGTPWGQPGPCLPSEVGVRPV